MGWLVLVGKIVVVGGIFFFREGERLRVGILGFYWKSVKFGFYLLLD